MMVEKTDQEQADLEWIQLQQQLLDNRKQQEGMFEKSKRKFKENPFVPVGLFATTFCLAFGLNAMRTGKTMQSQYAMRARVLAQGSTVAAILIGIGLSSYQTAQKAQENSGTKK